MQTPTRVQLPTLTGLRYLAAALVVIHHSMEVFAPDSWLERVFINGYVGVAFFFVLSGFILTWTHDDQTSNGTFYRRRFARIYPLYLATLIAAAAVAYVTNTPGKSAVGLLLAVVLLQAWFPVQSIYQAGNPPGWSLSAEAFFYALFPFLVGPIRRARLSLWPAVALVTIFGVLYGLSSGYSHWLAYYSPIYGLLYFGLGMIAAAAVQSGSIVRTPSVAVAATFTCAAYVIASGVLELEPRGLFTAVLLPFVVLLVVSGATQDLNGQPTAWASRPMILLGTWSFALYLVHFPMIRLLNRLIEGPVDWAPAVAIIGCLSVLAVTTATSALAYYAWEHPLERRIRGRNRPTARHTASQS